MFPSTFMTGKKLPYKCVEVVIKIESTSYTIV